MIANVRTHSSFARALPVFPDTRQRERLCSSDFCVGERHDARLGLDPTPIPRSVHQPLPRQAGPRLIVTGQWGRIEPTVSTTSVVLAATSFPARRFLEKPQKDAQVYLGGFVSRRARSPPTNTISIAGCSSKRMNLAPGWKYRV